MDSGREVTILDEYDCTVLPGMIRVVIESPRDPSLADIMSELHQSNGNIYFDGSYYLYADRYEILNGDTGWYMDLFVYAEPCQNMRA